MESSLRNQELYKVCLGNFNEMYWKSNPVEMKDKHSRFFQGVEKQWYIFHQPFFYIFTYIILSSN